MNTNTELATTDKQQLSVVPVDVSAGALELAIGRGDLSKMTSTDRLKYIGQVCQMVGLNPLTKPIDIMDIKGKTVLYANKSCAEQLRGLHRISTTIMERTIQDGLFIVRAKASRPLPGGGTQEDEAIGAVGCHDKAAPEDRANAMMKAETKAKRRVTLSIMGLGFMPDTSEVDDIKPANVSSVVNSAETATDRTALLNEVAAVDVEVVQEKKPEPPKVETHKIEPKVEKHVEAPKPAPVATVAAPTPPPAVVTHPAPPAQPAAIGELLDEDTVRNLEIVFSEHKQPAKCIEYFIAKKALAPGAALNTLKPVAANFSLKSPVRLFQAVDKFIATGTV